MKSVFICEHPQDQWALSEESKESSDPLKSLVYGLNMVEKRNRGSWWLLLK
jgi:hypothetical protein